MNVIEKFFVNKGFDLDKLVEDNTVYKVTNLDDAANRIKNAVKNNRHIHFVGDYDFDGGLV